MDGFCQDGKVTDQKQRQILNAALELFIRYGFKRTTMGDIAKQAGISRPALYLVFDNKEEIFKAGIANFTQEMVVKVREGLEQASSIGERLHCVLQVAFVETFEMMHDSPHIEELVECSHGFAAGLMESAHAALDDLLASIFKAEKVRLKRVKLTPLAAAKAVNASARGMKAAAKSNKEMRELIASLEKLTLAALDG